MGLDAVNDKRMKPARGGKGKNKILDFKTDNDKKQTRGSKGKKECDG